MDAESMVGFLQGTIENKVRLTELTAEQGKLPLKKILCKDNRC